MPIVDFENQPLHFGDFGELNVKNQRSVGRDHTGVTLCAVGEIVGNRKLALTSHLHAFNALLPAGNHHTLSKREFDRLTARDARIKHRAVGEFARLVHGDASAFFGFGAVADHDVGNL